MSNAPVKVNRGSFFEFVAYSGALLQTVAGNISGKSAIEVKHLVVNGKPQKTGLIGIGGLSRLCNWLASKQQFEINLCFKITTEVPVVVTSFFGQREELAKSGVVFTIKATVDMSVASCTAIQDEMYLDDKLPVEKKLTFKEAFESFVTRVQTRLYEIARRDELIALADEAVKKSRPNITGVLVANAKIKREDIPAFLALLYIIPGETPCAYKIERLTGKTVKELYEYAEHRLLTTGLISAAPASKATGWGFPTEYDFKLTPRGVQILKELTGDEALVKRILELRAKDEA